MHDMARQLADVEEKISRVQRQAEQERAMAEVLPRRFADNIAAFQQYIPDIARQFTDYIPAKGFEFFCNENGITNLRWTEEDTSLYGTDPFAECKQQIDSVFENASMMRLNFGIEQDFLNQIHIQYLNKMVEQYQDAKNKMEEMKTLPSSVPMCMMFGVGLGYQLGYLYERCQPKNLFIFEPDLDLFYASLFTFDWQPLLDHLAANNLALHLFIGQDEDSLMDDMLTALHRKGAYRIASFFGFWHYPSDKIFSLVKRVSKEFHLLTAGWGFFDDNLFALAHARENITRGTPFLLKNRKVDKTYSKIPVFVMGSGPSLDAALPYIKKYQDRAILISCGSNISALHKEGIKPDINVAIERIKIVPDFLGLLNDKAYLKDILFLSSDVIHPDIHQYFDWVGLGFKPNEPMFPLLNMNFKDMGQFSILNAINPLVGNTGLSYPVSLGFDNIYLFGIDNGYKCKEHHHSKHSAYYDKDGNPIQELSKLTQTAKGGSLVAGNFGGEVTANSLFLTSLKVMERLLKANPHVNCFNCSDGAKIEGAEPYPLKRLNLPNRIVDKVEVRKEICNLFRPIEADFSNLDNLLAVDFFNHVIDQFIAGWKTDFETREQISELMQQHFEYLDVLSKTEKHHIYRVLVGTTNYIFSLASYYLYCFEDEKEIVGLFNKEFKVIIIDYLGAMKDKYANAFNNKDRVTAEVMGHFRKG